MRALSVAVATILSAACTSSPESASGPDPWSGVREFAPTGPYAHRLTGLVLPEQVGQFERTHVSHYDPEGFNISGHYRIAEHRTIATIYHYPGTANGSLLTLEQLAEHFESAKRDVYLHRPGAQSVHDVMLSLVINGMELPGHHAVFQFEELPWFEEPAESHVWLFMVGNWYLKFRFTHPTEKSALVFVSEQGFIASFKWPIPESRNQTPSNLLQRPQRAAFQSVRGRVWRRAQVLRPLPVSGPWHS